MAETMVPTAVHVWYWAEGEGRYQQRPAQIGERVRVRRANTGQGRGYYGKVGKIVVVKDDFATVEFVSEGGRVQPLDFHDGDLAVVGKHHEGYQEGSKAMGAALKQSEWVAEEKVQQRIEGATRSLNEQLQNALAEVDTVRAEKQLVEGDLARLAEEVGKQAVTIRSLEEGLDVKRAEVDRLGLALDKEHATAEARLATILQQAEDLEHTKAELRQEATAAVGLQDEIASMQALLDEAAAKAANGGNGQRPAELVRLHQQGAVLAGLTMRALWRNEAVLPVAQVAQVLRQMEEAFQAAGMEGLV